MRHWHSIRCLLLAIAVAFAVLAIHERVLAGIMTFQGLGQVDSSTRNQASDISADGSTVVGWGSDLSNRHIAFRWTASNGMVPIDINIGPVPRFQPNRVSGDGSVVVGSCAGNGTLGFQWTVATGTVPIPSPYTSAGCAYGVSADGTTIVGYGGFGSYRLRVGQTPELLNGISPFNSVFAFATSADGSVVVGHADDFGVNGGSRAIRWTTAGAQLIENIPGTTKTIPVDVSSDGQTFVGFSETSTGARRPVIWRSDLGLVTLIGDVVNNSTTATDVSGNGNSIVGNTSLPFIGNQAIAWFNGGAAINLNSFLSPVIPPGWVLTGASGISDDGLVLAGTGLHNGQIEPWIATIPEPSSILLMSLSGLMLLRPTSAHRRRV